MTVPPRLFFTKKKTCWGRCFTPPPLSPTRSSLQFSTFNFSHQEGTDEESRKYVEIHTRPAQPPIEFFRKKEERAGNNNERDVNAAATASAPAPQRINIPFPARHLLLRRVRFDRGRCTRGVEESLRFFLRTKQK